MKPIQLVIVGVMAIVLSGCFDNVFSSSSSSLRAGDDQQTQDFNAFVVALFENDDPLGSEPEEINNIDFTSVESDRQFDIGMLSTMESQ